MATQDKSIKSFIGTRISKKQYKHFLASAKTPEERRAIKDMVLGEPVKFYGKQIDQEENPLQTDLIKK